MIVFEILFVRVDFDTDIKKKLQNLVSEHRQAIAEAKFALQDQVFAS